MKTKQCPMCDSETVLKFESYKSAKTDKRTGKPIVIPDVKVFYCTNSDCEHAWLPQEEQDRIDQRVARESRYQLTPEQIATIRKALGFDTKGAAANFLCLNTKAFVKWENPNSQAPNDAYDLLLRLVAYDRRNFDFIQYLHRRNFEFDKRDYQLLCDQQATKWRFEQLAVQDPLSKSSRARTLETRCPVQVVVHGSVSNAPALYGARAGSDYVMNEKPDWRQTRHQPRLAVG